jgi:hypothetical protein
MTEDIRAQEISNKLRCPRCNRTTDPDTDYVHIKTGKQCTTCAKCRAIVLKQVKKCYDPQKEKERHKELYQLKRKPTLRERCDMYEKLLRLLPIELVKQTCEQNDIQLASNFFDQQSE